MTPQLQFKIVTCVRTTSEKCLALFNFTPDEFLRRLVTLDETGSHTRYRRPSGGQNSVYLRVDGLGKRLEGSVSKQFMATVHWYARDEIHIG